MMNSEDKAAGSFDSKFLSNATATSHQIGARDEKHEDEVVAVAVAVTILSDERAELGDVKAWGETKSRVVTKKTVLAAIAIAWIVVVTIVTTIVLVSTRSNETSAANPSVNNVFRLESIRSVLLDNNVSSRQSLFDEGTVQYRALQWLSNEDPAAISASPETIVNRYILTVFFFNNNGYNWNDQLSFLSGRNICEWHSASTEPKGVFCDNSGIHLKLGSNAVSGTIPTELGKLSNLLGLVLHYNNLTGTIPTELGRISNLSYVTAVFNKLRGTIPSEMGELSLLAELYLGGNQLSGPIPTELGSLSSLNTLDLGGNYLNSTIPTQLGRLSHLEQLGLTNNHLHSTIPVQLGDLTSLINLDLSFNNIFGTVPTVLAELPKLASLILYETNVTGNLTATFCNAGRLPFLQTFAADCPNDVECSCCTFCSKSSNSTHQVLSLPSFQCQRCG